MELQSRFSERDWMFLTQLPYRIGLWMAHQDQGGGRTAYTRELSALQISVQTCHRKYKGIPLINTLMSGIDHANPSHDQWANALQDCRTALDLLRPHADAPTLNCFRLMLIDIAESVARAAPNGVLKIRNLYNGPKRGWLGLYPLMANAVRFGRGPNVTKAEKMAINKLIVALDAGHIVENWDLNPFKETHQA